jgi:hypothetical protein
MRRWWLLVPLVVMVSGCSYFSDDIMAPAEPVASGLQSAYVPPPPGIKARLQDYVHCEIAKQEAPEYTSLRDKFFFLGAPPATAIINTATPNDEEQVALAKWEVDRKACVLALADYINFFSPFDKIQGTMFASFQNSIRTIHNNLIKGTIGYGVALQNIRTAEEIFWGTLSERNKDLRNFIVGRWLDVHATP